MKTLMSAALLALVFATPALADPWKAKGWKGYGGNWGQAWDWGDWDDDDWDDGPRTPRYVRAPNGSYYFGRVQVDENGVQVRVQRNGGAPAGYELMEMDYRSLRNVLRGSAADFDRWLVSIPAGDVWRKHFEMRSLLALPAADETRPPAGEERDTVARVLGNFDRAAESPDMREIARAESFRTVHVVLHELATPPDERLVRQLSFSGRFLNRSLGALNTGPAWQKHLALPDGIVAAAERPRGDFVSRDQLKADELAPILERYDRVHRSQEYRVINSLPEFQVTHQRLAALVSLLRESPAPPISTAEELPPPPETRNR